jgi:pimeloyl-ACP methyl ester carboxylesterase
MPMATASNSPLSEQEPPRSLAPPQERRPSSILEREVEFVSQGVVCRGLFVRPEASTAAPLMILVHGLGGVYEMRLDAFARRFAAAGYAALTFDYRHFGRSDGHPRHLLVPQEQQRDIEAAIAYGRTLDGVDPSRLVLWGTSLAGGHVIDVASRRRDVTASIIQCPFTDGLASARHLSVLSLIGIGLFATADGIARLLGRPPVLVPLAGPRGTPALMTSRNAVQGVLALFPDGSRLSRQLSRLYRIFAERSVELGENLGTSEEDEAFAISGVTGSILLPSGTTLIAGVNAGFALKLPFWRPGKNLERIEAPMLVCVCEGDSVAPAGHTIRYASRASRCEVKVYPYDHFDIYAGEPYALVARDQLDFLARTVPVSTGVPRCSGPDADGAGR